jgi:proton-translocating NADH-quinone oxidoreductase chain M
MFELSNNILFHLLVLPLMGALVLLALPSWNAALLRITALFFSMLTFVYSLFLWVWFDKSTSQFQFIQEVAWVPSLNLNFTLGIDGISLFLVILTTLLIPLCILASWVGIKNNVKEYLIAFLVMESFLIGVFCVLDLLLFYVLFESVLIPMFLIIGIWGSRERKIRASYFFFLYTLLGSVLMLLGVLYLFFQVGSTDYESLLSFSLSFTEQKFLWLAFFASFATKVPMLPMHIWLPEAHVEAPTAGSVILAGVLLKLGTYGFIRFSFPLFPEASLYFTPLVYSMAAMAVVYTSLTAIRQTDLKRIIAYTSVAHMNLVVIGLFSFNLIGFEGAMLQSLSHGFVASALFLVIGVIYDRHHTRMVKYYGGLVHVMPLFTIIFLIFTMANIALPGTSSFIGELLILTGAYKCNTSITFIGATGMVLGGGYSLWLFNRVVYGNLKIQYLSNFCDIEKREFIIFLPLLIGTLVMGFYPEIFLDPMHMSLNNLLDQVKPSNY